MKGLKSFFIPKSTVSPSEFIPVYVLIWYRMSAVTPLLKRIGWETNSQKYYWWQHDFLEKQTMHRICSGLYSFKHNICYIIKWHTDHKDSAIKYKTRDVSLCAIWHLNQASESCYLGGSRMQQVSYSPSVSLFQQYKSIKTSSPHFLPPIKTIQDQN